MDSRTSRTLCASAARLRADIPIEPVVAGVYAASGANLGFLIISDSNLAIIL
jgi:hypothetical protein